MATQPSHNLIRDGIDSCADYILQRVKSKRVQCDVFVDRAGGVRVRCTAIYRGDEVRDRPAYEFVCSYRKATVCLEYIREDLAFRLKMMPKFLKEAA